MDESTEISGEEVGAADSNSGRRWLVQLEEMPREPRLLRDLLKRFGLCLDESCEPPRVCGESLDGAARNADDARRFVDEVLDVIALAANHSRDAIARRGQIVFEQTAAGVSRHHSVTLAATMHMVATLTGELTVNSNLSSSEREQLAREQAEREYQLRMRSIADRAAICHRHEDAARVQGYLNGSLPSREMYAIAELIKRDLAGNFGLLGMRSQFSRFSGSINNPDVLGEDARHAVANQSPPPNPMSLEECRQFIKALAAKWFEHLSARDR